MTKALLYGHTYKEIHENVHIKVTIGCKYNGYYD